MITRGGAARFLFFGRFETAFLREWLDQAVVKTVINSLPHWQLAHVHTGTAHVLARRGDDTHACAGAGTLSRFSALEAPRGRRRRIEAGN